jgi:protein-tyrosine-phosphatase/DNA-binding transcriptional ArsR family regulator
VGSPISGGDSRPPDILQLAGHPLRWRLLKELGRSDRQVRELANGIGEPQSLVSYHLGRLRAEDLVSMRRSSADRRDAYYTANLARCGELLTAASGALHPGLRLVPSQSERRADRLLHPAQVLFLCTGNGARSQMAEAFLGQLTHKRVKAFSAGSHPKSLHSNAVRAMREHDIDIDGNHPKHMDKFADRRFDYVITLCDRVREICPDFPGRPEPMHWSIADPAVGGGSDEETYPAFQRVAGELVTRIGFLVQLIEHDRRNQEVN